MEKVIIFSTHALGRLPERGVTKEEVETTIRTGERIEVKSGRVAFGKNMPFAATWKNRYYETKQVMPIAVEKEDQYIVVTVYAFYFGGTE